MFRAVGAPASCSTLINPWRARAHHLLGNADSTLSVPTLEDEPLVSGNLYFAKICELQGSGSTGGSIAPDTFPFVSVESPDVYRAQPSALCTTERSWGMCGPALAALERRREAGIHPCHL